ncbi:MAG: hypothetical protein LH466_02135 [Sphingomonas bacterium]|nr:hypothetical protein [Sphingomonas bacterium]
MVGEILLIASPAVTALVKLLRLDEAASKAEYMAAPSSRPHQPQETKDDHNAMLMKPVPTGKRLDNFIR